MSVLIVAYADVSGWLLGLSVLLVAVGIAYIVWYGSLSLRLLALSAALLILFVVTAVWYPAHPADMLAWKIAILSVTGVVFTISIAYALLWNPRPADAAASAIEDAQTGVVRYGRLWAKWSFWIIAFLAGTNIDLIFLVLPLPSSLLVPTWIVGSAIAAAIIGVCWLVVGDRPVSLWGEKVRMRSAAPVGFLVGLGSALIAFSAHLTVLPNNAVWELWQIAGFVVFVAIIVTWEKLAARRANRSVGIHTIFQTGSKP